ncbi:hypothetical protein ALC56_10665, partial [Trachymyrmex septentrionalis]
VILSLLQYDENNRGISAPSLMYVRNLTLRFERINNLPIIRLKTSTARLSMSKSTVLNIFNFKYCVNRLISSLTAMTNNVDKKFSRLLAIASTDTESANMLKTGEPSRRENSASVNNLDIFTYVNSKFVYVEKHVKSQLYHDIMEIQDHEPANRSVGSTDNLDSLATSSIYSNEDLNRLKNHIMFLVKKPSTFNTIARLWQSFITFDSASAGIFAIFIIVRVAKLVIDTLIYDYALYAVYGWSIYLLGTLWSSVPNLLLHLARPLRTQTPKTKNYILTNIGANGEQKFALETNNATTETTIPEQV